MTDLGMQLERQRAAATQRGRIVRSLVAHGGTARTDGYFAAMADAGVFNARHPDLVIPAPFPLIGCWPPECPMCGGEGSVALVSHETDLARTLGMGHRIGVEPCPPCGGSGFVGVYGTGSAARRAAAPHYNPLRA